MHYEEILLGVFASLSLRALKRSFVDARAQYCDIRREEKTPGKRERLITRARLEARGLP